MEIDETIDCAELTVKGFQIEYDHAVVGDKLPVPAGTIASLSFTGDCKGYCDVRDTKAESTCMNGAWMPANFSACSYPNIDTEGIQM